MPTFIGFNTIGQYKKFTLLDYELIKRDLLNAFNIRQGELVGRPDYGTALWRCEKPHQARFDVFVESLVLMVACGLTGYFIAVYLG